MLALPLLLQCFLFPLLPVWFRLSPKASLLGPAGLTQVQNGQEVSAGKLVRVERAGSKNQGRLHGRALPFHQVFSWWRLYSSISSRPLSISLLWLKIATGLRVIGKGEVGKRMCKHRVVSSFVDQVDVWNVLNVQIINKSHWANSVFPVETIYVSTLLTFLQVLFYKVILTLVGVWELLHSWYTLSLLKDTVVCLRSVYVIQQQDSGPQQNSIFWSIALLSDYLKVSLSPSALCQWDIEFTLTWCGLWKLQQLLLARWRML